MDGFAAVEVFLGGVCRGQDATKSYGPPNRPPNCVEDQAEVLGPRLRLHLLLRSLSWCLPDSDAFLFLVLSGVIVWQVDGELVVAWSGCAHTWHPHRVRSSLTDKRIV